MIKKNLKTRPGKILGWIIFIIVSVVILAFISEYGEKESRDLVAGRDYKERQNGLAAQRVQTEKYTELILSHKVCLGMTKLMVEGSWGKPSATNRTVTGTMIIEQWIYGESAPKYLYFNDGVLTSWQD